MTLPVFQFRDRLGESVNLSTADDRDEISTGELYHIVDVDTGTWCRPCGSTGCAHATQIEQILATTGLGRSQTKYDDLPGIANVTQYKAAKERVVPCAEALDIPIYDASSLALAAEHETTMQTADEQLIETTYGTEYADHIGHINEYTE